MNIKRINIFITGLFLFFNYISRSQLAGNYNIPGSYATLASVLNALNSQGISGPVIININAGYTETAPVGGFSLTASGTSLNPIVFQRSGVGPNPLLSAYSGGTATSTNALQDGVWRFIGCDHITIDGIDIVDSNTSNPATMEYGYCFFMASNTNGCQYNTIKNCTVKLNRINNGNGTIAAGEGSSGIQLAGATFTLQTSSLNAISSTGSNSYNHIYSNVIDNCNVGVSLKGVSTINPLFGSSDNDVGGLSSVTGNTITNYGGAANATYAANGIIIYNQFNANASNNLINSNTGAGIAHPYTLRGFYISNPGGNCSITNNTITLKSGSAWESIYAIESNGFLMSTFTTTLSIINNLITNCSHTTATFASFLGIVNTAFPDYLYIKNNTFANNSTAATNVTHRFIENAANVIKDIQITGNLIKDFSLTAVPNNSQIKAIHVISGSTTSSLSVSGNSIHSIAYTATVVGAFNFIHSTSSPTFATFNNNKCYNLALPCEIKCIYVEDSATFEIDGNIMDNISKTNSNTSMDIYGIHVVPGGVNGPLSVKNNKISNFNVPSSTSFLGIFVQSNASKLWTVHSNTIVAITGMSVGSNLRGMEVQNSKLGSSIYNNLINNLSGQGCFGISILSSQSTSGLSVYSNTIHSISTMFGNHGINVMSANNIKIYKNRIFDLEGNNGVTGMSVGQLGTNANAYVYNNLIADLRAPNAIGDNVLHGISLGSNGSNLNSTYHVFYNTIYLNASNTSTLFSATGIYLPSSLDSTQGKLNLKNNIIVNTSAVTGNAYGSALRLNFLQINYSLLSDNNLFYAGAYTPNNASVIYGGPLLNFATTQTALFPRDIHSVEEQPVFVSTNGLNPAFLKLGGAAPTQAESGAVTILGIIDDYAGNIRNTSTPDIGAWEGGYLLADSTAPVINSLSISSGECNLSGITVTAAISDASGVASGSLSPRCYYKINSQPYLSIQGSLTSGNNNNGNWSFSVPYVANPGDILSYYFVAQDVTSLSNIQAAPASTNFIASNVNNISSPPNTPFTLSIVGVLNGTYTVGSAGNFLTLTAAANAYNTWCITGPVVFLLNDVSYSSAETFPITFLRNPGASNTNSLLIRPNTAVTTTITGLINSLALLKFMDARHIAVDGVNSGGSALKLVNNNSGNTAGVWIVSSASNTLNAGCKKLTIKNLNILGGSNTTITNFGIVSEHSLSATPMGMGGINNDSINIINNIIERTYHAISVNTSATITTGGSDHWLISGNIIGPAVNGPNSIGGNGIRVVGIISSTVSNNLVRNVTTSTAGIYGIHLISLKNVSVSQNTITSISSNVITAGSNAIAGIRVESDALNLIIENNVISSVFNNSSSGYYGSRGITIGIGSGSGNKIINNFISDIYSGAGLGQFMPSGIAVDAFSQGFDIDNNTVNMASTYNAYIGFMASTAFYMNSNGGNIRVRNNIFSNTSDNLSSNNDIAYAIYSSVPSSAFAAIDFNNYYVGGGTSTLVLGYINSGNQLNLPAIQTSFGSNINSKNNMPVFVSATDLHLIPASNPAIDNSGTPLATITNDIDNQTRSLSAPDIGADEFYGFNCISSGPLSQTLTSYNVCSGQSIILNALGSAGNGLVHQWKVSTSPGGPYSNVVNGLGATSMSYSTSALLTGIYYYILQTTCTSASVSSISNEATVTVNAIPTSSISSNMPVCNGQALNLNGISNVGTVFSWSGPSSFIANVQNFTISNVAASNAGIYTLTVSHNSCSSSATIAISLTTPTITATNAGPYCIGNNIQLNTLAASGYTWSGPGGYNSNVQNPLILSSNLSMAGIYTLTADLGACLASSATTVSVNSMPASPILSYNGPLCAGANLLLSSSGGSFYSWLGMNGFSSAIQNPILINVSPSASGNYSLTISDINNCTSTATLAVVINPLPNMSITTTNTFICAGQSTTLSVTGANSYTWNTANNSNSILVTPTVTTTYTVTGTSVAGCIDSVMYTQNVSICTGVETSKLNTSSGISIYPNPNNGSFYICEFENNIEKEAEIYNSLGQLIIKLKIESSIQQINISKYEKGFYLLKIKTGNTVLNVSKIIKD